MTSASGEADDMRHVMTHTWRAGAAVLDTAAAAAALDTAAAAAPRCGKLLLMRYAVVCCSYCFCYLGINWLLLLPLLDV